MKGTTSRKANQTSGKRIGPAHIELLRSRGPAAIDYYRRFGLAEVRSRAFNIALSGLIPLGGMLFFGWTAPAMLLFMVIDAAGTVLADFIRYSLGRAWMIVSHKLDHEAGQILLIADGLEDGSGRYADQGEKSTAPGILLFFGTVSLMVLVPLLAAAAEPIGGSPLRQIATEKHFAWAVAIDSIWRFIQGIAEVLRARMKQPGDRMVFMESGGVTVLCAGMLMLVWLPITFGAWGLYAMFVVLYVFRLAFGIFAFIWTPKAFTVMERRVREGDYTVRKRGNLSPLND